MASVWVLIGWVDWLIGDSSAALSFVMATRSAVQRFSLCEVDGVAWCQKAQEKKKGAKALPLCPLCPA